MPPQTSAFFLSHLPIPIAVGSAIAVVIPFPPSCRNAGGVDWQSIVIGSVRGVKGAKRGAEREGEREAEREAERGAKPLMRIIT